jgi:hypothetical protein
MLIFLIFFLNSRILSIYFGVAPDNIDTDDMVL